MEGSGEGVILKEIQKFIIVSCDFDTQPNENFQKFHTAFLKFSFSALKVEIDYEAKTILTWNSKPLTESSIMLFNFRDALLERVNYSNLEETLLGCVEDGHFNERFYIHLLKEFKGLPNEMRVKTA